MSQRRNQRESRRQLGKFYTPGKLADSIVEGLCLHDGMRLLEPSAGDGSFIGSILNRVKSLGVSVEIDAVEIERQAAQECLSKYGNNITVYNGDFYTWSSSQEIKPFNKTNYWNLVKPEYDLIIGNPPFGGTIASEIQDALDEICGERFGEKIKKESYSLFIVKSVDHLKTGGQLVFICSDTFLTINTMKGLRKFLQQTGEVTITAIDEFSEETKQPMVVLSFKKTGVKSSSVCVNGRIVSVDEIEKTPNLSWAVNEEYSQYFSGGKRVGDFLIATSGMTIGNNELFVREIKNGSILEPYEFEFFEEPITLLREISKARNNTLSQKKIDEIKNLEAIGKTKRNIRWSELSQPVEITLPSSKYRYYNKSQTGNRVVYCDPSHVIYWENNGDAAYTFKKNGNWYLHGVGGKKFFGREGITWSLVSKRLKLRYLPEGYILDSGAPCAFLREGVDRDELFFLMAWGFTDIANNILKTIINHTRNIQGKDFERLPYPYWVDNVSREKIILEMKSMVDEAINGAVFTNDSPRVRKFNEYFRML